jgi:hypothetical protein
MTKAELIKQLEIKTQKASPIYRGFFLRGLKYKNKTELEHLLNTISVARDGDICYR